MQINLRKANALAKALQSEAHKLPLATVVGVSIYQIDTYEPALDAAGAALRKNLESASDLLGAAYDLRRLLGAAFQSSGIDDLLTEKANLDAQEKLLGRVLDRDNVWSSATDAALATPRLQAVKDAQAASTRQGYGNSDVLNVRIPETAFDGYADKLREIRKRKSEIADELLNLNTVTRIDVPAHVQALADAFKLN